MLATALVPTQVAILKIVSTNRVCNGFSSCAIHPTVVAPIVDPLLGGDATGVGGLRAPSPEGFVDVSTVNDIVGTGVGKLFIGLRAGDWKTLKEAKNLPSRVECLVQRQDSLLISTCATVTEKLFIGLRAGGWKALKETKNLPSRVLNVSTKAREDI
ncbi:hypothetical protein SUGI_0439970 [Cryptomeria japonica]|nr:hypothetical protein SUGI_0439970 [Cryptomeria japonica]